MPDLSGLAVTRYETAVTDAEVQQTLDVLRKQRATFEAREGRASQDGDRVTLDFAGTIDGVPFEGGKAEGFPSCWARVACCPSSRKPPVA